MAAEQRRGRRRDPIRIGAVIALALAAAFVVWLLVRNKDNSSNKAKTTATTTKAPPPRVVVKVVPLTILRRVASLTPHPIYWEGPKSGVGYELTQTAGKYYVRYLPRGVRAGDRRPFPLVATYPIPDAYKAVQTAAKESGAVTFPTPRGGIAVYNRDAETNVYLAFPNSQFQVEVYDPNARRARQLVRSGAIRPIS